MKSPNEDIATLESEENLNNVVEETTLHNLSVERKFKTELERNERRAAYLKFQIDDVMVQELQNIENAIHSLRKPLSDLQTEVNQMGPEITTQKATIDDDECCHNRLQDCSDVTNAMLCVANDYKQMKLTLKLQIQKCDSLYSEINQLKADMSSDCNLITSMREDEQKMINQVESRTLAAKHFLNAVSNEVGFLEIEFENYSALKNALLKYNTELGNAENNLDVLMEEQGKTMASFGELMATYNVRNLQLQDELNEINAELQAMLSDDKKGLHSANINDDCSSLQHTLTDLQSQLNDLRDQNAMLKSQKDEYNKVITSLQCQAEDKKHELKIKLDLETLQTKGKVGELVASIDGLLNDVTKLNEIDSHCLKVLRAEISSLEAESESCGEVNNEDAVAIQKTYDNMLEEVGTLDSEITELQIAKNELEEALQELTMAEKEHELVVQTVKDTIADLNRVKCQMETQFEKQVNEVDNEINYNAEVIDAVAVDTFESDLLLALSQMDEESIDSALAEKRSQLWAATSENERKWTKLEDLNRALDTERQSLEASKTLLMDLRKNSIPKDKLPDHPIFVKYMAMLKDFETISRRKQKLEEQKKPLLERQNSSVTKSDKYNYGKFRQRFPGNE